MIEVRAEKGADLTIFTSRGKLTAGELEAKIRAFYESGPTALVLWDFSDADISALSTAEIQALAQLTGSLSRQRTRGRTALIAPEALTYGLGRMYQTNAEIAESTTQTMIFRTAEEAWAWLGFKNGDPAALRRGR